MLPRTRRRGCGSGFSTPLSRPQPLAMIGVQRAVPGAEPAVGQFVNAFQLAINTAGQLERIAATLELCQLC